MQQVSMVKASRLRGVIWYNTLRVIKTVLFVSLLCVLLSVVPAMITVVWGGTVKLNSLSLLYSINGTIAILLCARSAYSETRFFTSMPTPRWSIYLGVVYKMLLFAVIGTIAAALLSVFDALFIELLNLFSQGKHQIGIWDLGELISISISMNSESSYDMVTTVGGVAGMVLGSLLPTMLSVFTASGFVYLYVCLLRRWKAATITATIGIPVLLITLLLIPSITGFYEQASSMTRTDILQSMPLLYSLFRAIEKIVVFIIDEWPIIRTLSGLGCWLLAYPIMSRTSQPS